MTRSHGHVIIFSSFCYLKTLLTYSDRYKWLGKEITALYFSSFCHLKTAFGKIIRLQKSDLKIIFHYIYKYKIITYTGGLPFYLSGDLQIAIAISFYFIDTSLLLMCGLGHI